LLFECQNTFLIWDKIIKLKRHFEERTHYQTSGGIEKKHCILKGWNVATMIHLDHGRDLEKREIFAAKAARTPRIALPRKKLVHRFTFCQKQHLQQFYLRWLAMPRQPAMHLAEKIDIDIKENTVYEPPSYSRTFK
jgi:hypothetical protein